MHVQLAANDSGIKKEEIKGDLFKGMSQSLII